MTQHSIQKRRNITEAVKQAFPSQNDYGIPDLELQNIRIPVRTAMVAADSGEATICLYHTFKPLPGSVIGFWTDDHRFEQLFSRPEDAFARLMAHSPYALVVPDFSAWNEHPFAVQLWALYRSRWVSRFWQLHGQLVIPSLSWSALTLPLIGLGIPTGSVVACEARPRFKDPGLLLEGLQEAIRQVSPSAIVFYGADESLIEKLPIGPVYVCCEAWSPRRRIRDAAL